MLDLLLSYSSCKANDFCGQQGFQYFLPGQINQSQSLFAYAQNESVDTFAKPDFVPMFADNITWYNDSIRQAAEKQCGDDYECLFDVASTNDLSVGMVTKDISIQLVNESNALGKSTQMK